MNEVLIISFRSSLPPAFPSSFDIPDMVAIPKGPPTEISLLQSGFLPLVLADCATVRSVTSWRDLLLTDWFYRTQKPTMTQLHYKHFPTCSQAAAYSQDTTVM